MAYLRAYSMRSSGVMPGRGALKGDPFFGALIGAAAPLVRKFAGKALGKLTGGRLIGAGGGAAILRKAAGAGGIAGGIAAARKFGGLPNLPGPFQSPFGKGKKKYRRMNAGNAKALRRAFRRVEAFGKLASKAGYVRRPSSRRKKVC